MIEQFKALMRGKFPTSDLSIFKSNDEFFFKNIKVHAMWEMYKICNEWKPIEVCPENQNVLLYCEKNNYIGSGQKIKEGVFFDADQNMVFNCKITHWRPLPIPPLTTEGGV